MRIVTIITLIIVFLPITIVSAQGYKPLVGIPGVTDPNTDFNSYITALYVLSISIAALLAVIKIVIAGIKWMLTDVVTSKSEAKNDIKGALIGLLVVLSAVLILTVINPKITNVDVSPTKVVNRGAPTNPTDNLVAPAPKYNNAAYTAINTNDYSSAEVQAFVKSCTEANNKPDYIKDNGMAYCYKTGVGKMPVRKSFCDNKFGMCTPEKIKAENDCVAQGGSFTVDPQALNFGICIR